MDSERAAEESFITSFDPATGEEIGRARVATEVEISAAIAASRAAFTAWRETTFAERRALIMGARESILAEMDEIALLISRESGKPVSEAISMEIAPVLDLMQWIARRVERFLRPKRIGIGLYTLLGRSSKLIYKPLGVVGIIPAWNYPFSIPLGEAVTALMAGNSVILKPSELTPFVGLKIGEIFEKAGAPENLVQVVTGAGETGAALVRAAPDKIMFTGSVATGKRIAAAAAENLTSTVLELGGKDPMIVFDDANLELAAGAAVWGAFCNAGQSCSSVERLYVQEGAAERLTRLIVEKVNDLRQGPGTDENVSIGPMSSERQLRIVERHVEEFRRAGAKIETGYEGPHLSKGDTDNSPRVRMRDSSRTLSESAYVSKGDTDNSPRVRVRDSSPTLSESAYVSQGDTETSAILVSRDSDEGVRAPLFYPPTVIIGATNDMRPMQEETFGPTLPIAIFKTEDEAIALANDSEFGLTASVWTCDGARARRVANALDAGSVCINEVLYTHGIGQTPWGGFKNSGRGRTHGLDGLMELVQPQHIHINHLPVLPDAWWMPYSANARKTFRDFATKFATGSLIKTATMVPQLLKRIWELRK